MKERAITLKTHDIRAILDGHKTQTRRIMKPQPVPTNNGSNYVWYCEKIKASLDVKDALQDGNVGWYGLISSICPLGGVGDRLWVRETFGFRVVRDAAGGTGEFITYRASKPDAVYCTCASGDAIPMKWKPSSQMPRSASRILLEITGVRVERLQDISEEDAVAEGIITGRYGNEDNWLNGFYIPGDNQPYQTAKAAYAELWRSIHGVDSWYMNSWVWVVEFKRVTI